MLLLANNASAALTAAITSGATFINIDPATAGKFPTPSAATDYFMVTLEDRNTNPVSREICKCTARNGAQLTVIRAQEGTAAIGFAAGAIASNRITAASLASLVANLPTAVQLYLGTYVSAPTQTLEGKSLVPGNLYYDSTLQVMRQFDGVMWNTIGASQQSFGAGVYLGAFATPPIVMGDGSALLVGTLYYNTVSRQMFEWDGSAWNPASASAQSTGGSQTVGGNQTVTGNQVVNGNGEIDGDLHVKGNATIDGTTFTGALDIAGKPVVTSIDLSGTANSQKWPNGNLLQWGTASTDAGGHVTITFNPPFPNTCVFAIAAPTNATLPSAAIIAQIIAGELSANSMRVGSYFPATGGAPAGPVVFSWLAIGH